MSILSNKNYFTSKKYDNNNDIGGIRKKSLHNEQVENRDVTKMKVNEKGNNNNNNDGCTNKLVDINVDNSDHLNEITKNKKNKGDQFDMIDLNELPKKIDPTKSSDINIEEVKQIYFYILLIHKYVFEVYIIIRVLKYICD